jgi:hypothetical protein
MYVNCTSSNIQGVPKCFTPLFPAETPVGTIERVWSIEPNIHVVRRARSTHSQIRKTTIELEVCEPD